MEAGLAACIASGSVWAAMGAYNPATVAATIAREAAICAVDSRLRQTAEAPMIFLWNHNHVAGIELGRKNIGIQPTS